MHANNRHRNDMVFFRGPDGQRIKDDHANNREDQTRYNKEGTIVGGPESIDRACYIHLATDIGCPKVMMWLATAQVVVEFAMSLWLFGLRARANGNMYVPAFITFDIIAKAYSKHKECPLPCIATTKACLGDTLDDLKEHGLICCITVDDIFMFNVPENCAVPLAKFLSRRQSDGSTLAKSVTKDAVELREVIADIVNYAK